MRIDAQDIKGKKFSINLKDFQARIFQHEYDHLEVIIRILLRKKRTSLESFTAKLIRFLALPVS